MTSDREQIEQAVHEFIAAYEAGDVERVVAYYADDLIKVRAGAPPENKEETARRIRDVLARYRGQLSVHNDEIVVSGDMAFVRGGLSLRLVPKDGAGPEQALERRFLEIWRKQSGRWRVVRTMDNAP